MKFTYVKILWRNEDRKVSHLAQIELPMFLEYQDRRPVGIITQIFRLKKNMEREFGGKSISFLFFCYKNISYYFKIEQQFFRGFFWDISHLCKKTTNFYNQTDGLLINPSSYFGSSYLSNFLVVVSFSLGFWLKYNNKFPDSPNFLVLFLALNT